MVVGVGSVLTRCYIALLEGWDIDDSLFLQIKEAEASVLERYAGKGIYPNTGNRCWSGGGKCRLPPTPCLTGSEASKAETFTGGRILRILWRPFGAASRYGCTRHVEQMLSSV
jgi:hypothetical protein